VDAVSGEIDQLRFDHGRAVAAGSLNLDVKPLGTDGLMSGSARRESPGFFWHGWALIFVISESCRFGG
jgi:hypothetical protein